MEEFKALAFEVIECYKCHVQFCITKEHNKNLLQRKTEFFCPNGHGQVYTGKSEKEKIGELNRKINVCSIKRKELTNELDKKEKSIKAYKMLYCKEKKKQKSVIN